VERFLLKRSLIDSIRMKSHEVFHRIVEDICSKDIAHVLNEPCDATLNTPLHLAVCSGCKEMVAVLITRGADSHVRNLRGDTPTQFFALPRLREAARECRRSPASIVVQVRQGGSS